MKRFTLMLVLPVIAAAQQVVAPTPSQVGPIRGERTEGYNIVNSFELGYRFRSADGSLDKYRSDVNFGNGVRLLGTRLSVNSLEGHGRFFDELLLNTQGLGNDPYQFASLRIGKNRLYQYDLIWRSNDYFNPALPIANGQHFLDTTRHLQDHDLVLFPASRIRFFLGYSRNNQRGPALSTISDPEGLPLFADTRRLFNEYRFGSELRFGSYRFHWIRAWENFREDTPYSATPGTVGDPSFPLTVNSFQRAEPYHGNTPSWRLALFREANDWFAVNARFTYSGGRRDFVMDESLFGQNRFGPSDRQILVFGDARRPVTTANLTFSLFPSAAVTFTNHTAFHHTRMEGDASYQELDNRTLVSNFLNFQFLGIRSITNSTDVQWRVVKRLSLFGGYRFTNRRIRSIEQFSSNGFEDVVNASQENTLHAGVAGFRLKPVEPLTVVIESEIGRADRPFYTISDRNYHSLGGRVQYKRGSLLLSAATRTFYNTNSVSLSFHTQRSRNYSANAAWAPSRRFAFDASYSKIHLDTLTGLAYFVNFQMVTGDRSLYVSNLHTGSVGVNLELPGRMDLYLGYTRVQDVGDGRSRPELAPPAAGNVPGFLAAVQTFPLSYQSPLARISIPFFSRLRLNFGYQFYHYKEDFFRSQNYRAHTGFSSLLWSF